MICIHVDVPLTRRKTMHHCVDQRAQLLFSSRRLIDCLNYAFDQGEAYVMLQPDPERPGMVYRVELRLQVHPVTEDDAQPTP